MFPWVGTKKLTTLALAFQSREFRTTPLAFAIELQACETDGVAHYAKAFSEGDAPSTDALMSGVSKPNVARFDGFLSWDLMTLVTVRERLEIAAGASKTSRLTYNGLSRAI